MRKVLFFFGQLSDGDVEWLTGAGDKRHVPAGSDIIREGEWSDCVFVVLSGELSVLPSSSGGKEVARLASGELIGEMSFVDSRPPSATVRARKPSVVLAIDKERLGERLEDDPGFGRRFYKALAVCLSQSVRRDHFLLGLTGGVDLDRAQGLAQEQQDQMDDLDETVLDSLHLAGERFNRMLQRLAG